MTVEVNSKAPAFAAQALDGSSVRLVDYVGRNVVLLEFWSIFCKSCIQEMPVIERLQHAYGEEGLAVLSVNTDFFSAKKIRSFMEKAGIHPPYPILRDTRQEIVESFGVELLPVTVIIDREGWIRLYQEGYRPGDERRFESKVRYLLGKAEDEDVTLASRGGVTAFAPTGVQLVAVGTRLSSLEGSTVGGQRVHVLEGDRPHLFFFWSLYCNPCRAEFPRLAALGREHPGLATYAVNVDSSRLLPRVERFLASHPGLGNLMDDPGHEDGDLAQALGVRVTPTVVLTDATGHVVHAEAGTADMAALGEKIGALLSGQPFDRPGNP